MTDAPTQSFNTNNVTRMAASALVRAAIETAEGSNTGIAVAVTDASGHLVVFERTDSARFLAVTIAIDKAWTAASSGMATHTWNAVLASEPKVAPLAYQPRLVGVAGGHPIVENGQIIGAIGISGGTYVQDQAIAEKALEALGFQVQG